MALIYLILLIVATELSTKSPYLILLLRNYMDACNTKLLRSAPLNFHAYMAAFFKLIVATSTRKHLK